MVVTEGLRVRRQMSFATVVRPTSAHAERGIALLEILIALVITMVGLLGMAHLHSKLLNADVEAYQRSQALLLLQDMAERIGTNRDNAANYVTGVADPLGTDDDQPADCTTLATPTTQELDACDWSNALKGAAETKGGNNVGGLIGARGCVECIGTCPDDGTYQVTVVWQGLHPTAASVGSTCGQGEYDSGGNCEDDKCRRVLTTLVRIGTLN